MAVAAVAAAGCLLAPAADATTFNANGGTLGNIPDSPAGGALCGDYTGASLDVTFTASGLTAPAADVEVGMVFGQGATPIGPAIGHTWGGDVQAVLISPGGIASKLIISRTGAVTATSCGDGSDLHGPYVFADGAPATPSWWSAAAAVGDANFVAPGSYQAATAGGAAGGGANTPITPAFSGLSTAQLNGTWTLRVLDGGQGDTGSVTKAALAVNGVSGPSLAATIPASPADDNAPVVKGTAPAGSSISIYTNDTCTGSPAATGTAAQLAGAGIAVPVAGDATTPIRATSSDVFTSGCSNALDYVEDSTPPAKPSLTATSPASPGTSATPRVQGDAEAGSTVRLYGNDSCSGSPAATGGAASLAAGISVPVATDATTHLAATATDAAGHTSGCSDPIAYVHDDVPPAAPSLTATVSTPAPRVLGSAEAGTRIALFSSPDCSGPVTATGPDSELADPGIPVTVAAETDTQITAQATDAAGLTSPCSSPITFVHQTSPGGSDDVPPDTTFKKRPKKHTADETPTFKASASEPGSTFRCSADRKPFRPCGAKRTFHMHAGRHKVQIAAVDPAGNVDPTPAALKFTIRG